jgi:hypothetical protein
MCMQCVATAMTAATTATGLRAYVARRHPAWLTPKRLRRISAGLIGAAMLASGLSVS